MAIEKVLNVGPRGPKCLRYTLRKGARYEGRSPVLNKKLNRIATLILWGKYSVLVVPIDKTIKGKSYSNLKLDLQDFQVFYVSLFKTGLGTLQDQFNQ